MPSRTLRDRIDAALELAETSSWEAVRLYQVSEILNIKIADVRRHFSEKDELVDAWFDRADQAMLKLAAGSDLRKQSTIDQLLKLIMAWDSQRTRRFLSSRQKQAAQAALWCLGFKSGGSASANAPMGKA